MCGITAYIANNPPGGDTMNHYQQLIADEILSVRGQKDYCLQVLSAGGLQSWESKEYSDLVEEYDQKLKGLNERLPAAG
uniref:Uncharacterized protein n=2 Tax=Pseudomonas TaxID=286 RepID=A0A6B7PX64_PSEPU|nr:hypothetical protein [Pseudomonas putida]QFX76675.1 hypothetical protein [Pseudomonas putida]